MNLYYVIILFIIGIHLGSFYNVIGYRLPKGESIVFPPSHCTKCDHKLSVFELIPIFSYFLQFGKCTKCFNKISFFYPFFEFLTGILFALSYIVFGISIDLVIALIIISMTIIIFVSDYLYFVIPDEVLIVTSILLLISIFFKYDIYNVIHSLFNGFISFGIMYSIKKLGDTIFKKESMGGGDVKLMFVLGLLFGWEMSLLSIFVASFIGLPASIFILCSKPNEEKIIPFGPFLCMAALLILFFKIDINTIVKIVLAKHI